MKLTLTSALASLALLVACATPMAAPTKTHAGMLTDSAGMTLYTFDKDPADANKSVCNGDCATKWPPLVAAAGAAPEGAYTVITRDDGTQQWAYKGKPLYTWFKDQKPGDTTGDGVNNVWHTAKP
jgi:predicted lipoprotein with Yx(FWY)xxD motif